MAIRNFSKHFGDVSYICGQVELVVQSVVYNDIYIYCTGDVQCQV